MPLVVNTSFNWGWDPIVCTPRNAYEVFRSSALDVLCLGHLLLVKDGAKGSGDGVLGSSPPPIVQTRGACASPRPASFATAD